MRKAALCVGLAYLAGLTACTNPYDPGQRAVGGAAIGAGTGAAIGAIAGGGRGAGIGALAGAAFGAVAGAASTPQPPPPGYGYPPPPSPPPGPASFNNLLGVWRGAYYGCGQGPTGLTLQLTPAGPAMANVDFHFYGLPRNPGVPDGEYQAVGQFNPYTGVIDITPTQWIRQPPGYTYLAMSGSYQPATGQFAGQIHGCAGFRLRRIG